MHAVDDGNAVLATYSANLGNLLDLERLCPGGATRSEGWDDLFARDKEGVLIQQFNEPAAGQTVFHLHFHVLPRREGVALRPHTGKMADHGLLAEHAQKIRTALES